MQRGDLRVTTLFRTYFTICASTGFQPCIVTYTTRHTLTCAQVQSSKAMFILNQSPAHTLPGSLCHDYKTTLLFIALSYIIVYHMLNYT